MSKVSVFAKFSCQEGKGDEMDEALRAIVEASESVDGVESYSYHRGEDGTYWFFALMSSMEAAQKHGDNEAMQAAMPALMALMAGPPDMAMTVPGGRQRLRLLTRSRALDTMLSIGIAALEGVRVV